MIDQYYFRRTLKDLAVGAALYPAIADVLSYINNTSVPQEMSTGLFPYAAGLLIMIGVPNYHRIVGK